MFIKQITVHFFAIMIALLGISPLATSQGCSQPSNLNSSVLASGTVALSWSSASGAINYTVQYRVGNAGAWTSGGVVTTTSQVLAGLLPETVYTWRVRANCSTFSSVATFNSGGGVGGNTACSQPSNTEANVTSPTAATLSWASVEGALYYTVQYRLNNLGAWTNGGSVTGTSISISNLAVNSEYGWRVKASCSVYSSVALFNTGVSGNGGNASCSQPSNTEAFLLTNTMVELSWSAVQEAQSYMVQYRVGLSGAWIGVAPTTATTLVLSGLLLNTEYSWRVKASCSDYSSQAVFTTGGGGSAGGGGGATSCSSPSNTNTLSVAPTSAVVEWEANPEALNYTLQYKLELGGSYVTVGTFTAATATITGLLSNTQYVWRVKANCSPYGSDVQFSTPVAFNSATSRQEMAASTQIFPNPAATQLQIQVSQPGARVFISNITGVAVVDLTMVEQQELINVSNWTNGIYFIKIQQMDGSAQTSKLVVAH
jgi:hypothetical protein